MTDENVNYVNENDRITIRIFFFVLLFIYGNYENVRCRYHRTICKKNGRQTEKKVGIQSIDNRDSAGECTLQ